jgi:hypothetical protein
MQPESPQGLVFSRRGAHQPGFVAATNRKTAVRIRRGVYAEATWWHALRSYQRYAFRVRAAAVSLDDPILAAESAAVIHGLPVFGEPDIHLLSLTSLRGYRRNGVSVHWSEDERTIERIDGIRVTSLLDTTLDLIRVLPLALGVAVIDAALRSGLDLTGLRDTLATQTSTRGCRKAQEAIDRASAASESVLESISRVVIERLGYPPPELQVEFHLPTGAARTDFFWRDESIVGEADGNGKYFGSGKPTDEVVRAERRREVALRRVVRNVARWEWADATRPMALDAILSAAGLRRIRPADPHVDRALRNRRAGP